MAKMNLPNKLTILRVCMIPLFMIFLCVPMGLSDTVVRIAAAVIFALTSLTDMLDGKIARKYNLITDFGKLMDPLADKCMVFGAMLGILVYEGCADLRPVFVWAALIVMARELAVTSLRLIAASAGGEVIAAAWLGKVKTVTQILAIIVILLEPLIPLTICTQYHVLSYVTIAAMTVMTVWSGVDYFRVYGKYIKTV